MPRLRDELVQPTMPRLRDVIVAEHQPKTVSGACTEVTVGYLKDLRSSLSDILAQVNAELDGQSGSSATPAQIVDSDLAVLAGGGGIEFDAAKMLNAALGAMGDSVQNQLTWLSGTVTTMIGQITTSIGSLSDVESLNTGQVSTLLAEFDQDTGSQIMM